MSTPIDAWLRSNAHPLTDLHPLLAIVGDARVVAIGESTHRIHDFYQVRHAVLRFLVAELGFTAFVMESGFPEALAVNEWICGGPGDLDRLLADGVTYHMGKCREMRDLLVWLRSYNATHERQVHFYGMDIPDSSASARPAIMAVLRYLDEVDEAYAAAVRRDLLPLFDYLPADRTGLAWAAPAIQAYLALEPAHRNELTARIGDLVERLQAQRVGYTRRSGAFETALRGAVLARHADAFLRAMASGPGRTYGGANIRDAAMAETVEWILEREERIVVAAANGHVQRWPFTAPPIVNEPLTMAGEHLADRLGDAMVVIGSCFGGGDLFLHRALPEGPPGHTETFVETLNELAPDSLDALLAGAGVPSCLIDLRQAPPNSLASVGSTMTGSQRTPVDPVAAFDAVIYVDRVTPWHHTL